MTPTTRCQQQNASRVWLFGADGGGEPAFMRSLASPTSASQLIPSDMRFAIANCWGPKSTIEARCASSCTVSAPNSISLHTLPSLNTVLQYRNVSAFTAVHLVPPCREPDAIRNSTRRIAQFPMRLPWYPARAQIEVSEADNPSRNRPVVGMDPMPGAIRRSEEAPSGKSLRSPVFVRPPISGAGRSTQRRPTHSKCHCTAHVDCHTQGMTGIQAMTDGRTFIDAELTYERNPTTAIGWMHVQG